MTQGSFEAGTSSNCTVPQFTNNSFQVGSSTLFAPFIPGGYTELLLQTDQAPVSRGATPIKKIGFWCTESWRLEGVGIVVKFFFFFLVIDPCMIIPFSLKYFKQPFTWGRKHHMFIHSSLWIYTVVRTELTDSTTTRSVRLFGTDPKQILFFLQLLARAATMWAAELLSSIFLDSKQANPAFKPDIAKQVPLAGHALILFLDCINHTCIVKLKDVEQSWKPSSPSRQASASASKTSSQWIFL
jgi:hypothetical protein